MYQDNFNPNNKKGNSCSSYWLTNILLSFFNGIFSRNKQRKEADKDREFQEMLTKKKIMYEDRKAILDEEFKLRQKEQQREYSNIQNELKLELDKEKDELCLFMKGWPLRLSLHAMQDYRNSISSIPVALHVVIATHRGNDNKVGAPIDYLSSVYDGLVDHVQTILKGFDIPENYILRFKTGVKASGGAALANIFAMMNCIPTIVVMPRVDLPNRKFIISIGCWYTNSKIPSQRRVYIIDYDEVRMRNDSDYQNSKRREIENLYISLILVMNDVYALINRGLYPKYPKYAQDKNILTEYHDIASFMYNEYQSLIDQTQNMININGEDYNASNILIDKDVVENLKENIKLIQGTLN
jgi:hypothetical protein